MTQKVRNMTSSRGNDVPNQFTITDEEKGTTTFQSYNSIIAVKEYGKKTKIYEDYDYSITTGKYRNDFLEEGIAETRAKLKSGEYIAVDFEVA